MAAILTGAGITLARLRRRVAAVRPPAHVAEQLQVTLADPTLVYTFTMHAADDRVVEWVRIYLHPDQAAPVEAIDLTTGTWSMSEPM